MEKIMDVDNEELSCLMESGYLNLAKGRFKEAQDIFEGVEILVPNSEVVQIALGNLYFDQGKPKEALSYFQKALSLNPEDGISKVYVAKGLLANQKREEAVAKLKEVEKLDAQESAKNLAKSLLQAIGEVK
ncbi:MAG: tetratricopeptide repeat protein [bacterium]